MRICFYLLLFLIPFIGIPQNDKKLSLNIGDIAPPLQVKEGLKGNEVKNFEKGKIYVLEFWATWCAPCKAAMPHLSVLADKYKNQVSIIGIDFHEFKTTTKVQIKEFVRNMGDKMDYAVAIGDDFFMESDWIKPSGEEHNGIPKSFVINAQGRLAWIGYPKDLDNVLSQIVENKWDIKKELDKRNLNKYLAELDDSLNYELMKYNYDAYYKSNDFGKPDSCLWMVSEIIKKEPKLKYAPFIASYTFYALLKTNMHEAFNYGKEVLITPTYEDPACDIIIDAIKRYSDKFKITKEINLLAAEAYQVKINQVTYPEIVDVSKLYYKMAEFYYRANDKFNAIKAEENAIQILQSKKDFSDTDMINLKSRLTLYKNM